LPDGVRIIKQLQDFGKEENDEGNEMIDYNIDAEAESDKSNKYSKDKNRGSWTKRDREKDIHSVDKGNEIKVRNDNIIIASMNGKTMLNNDKLDFESMI